MATNTRKRKNVTESGKRKVVEKHILDNPFKIPWPHHSDETVKTVFGELQSVLSERYNAACTRDHALSEPRRKRLFFHGLECRGEAVMSVNAVARMFENPGGPPALQCVLVEEKLIPTRILDHILFSCGLHGVPLVKGPLSAYFLQLLGRKKMAIIAVPESLEVTFGGCELVAPSLPFLKLGLPPMQIRVLDSSPSQKAIDKMNLKKAIKKAKDK